MQGQPVEHGAHGVLAHPEAQVAPVGRVPLEIARALDGGVVGWGEIGRTAHQRRQPGGDRVERLAEGRARGDRLAVGEARQVGIPAGRQAAVHGAGATPRPRSGYFCAQAAKVLLPGGLGLCAALDAACGNASAPPRG